MRVYIVLCSSCEIRIAVQACLTMMDKDDMYERSLLKWSGRSFGGTIRKKKQSPFTRDGNSFSFDTELSLT